MTPLTHGFLAGLFSGAFGLVCLLLYLAQRWEMTGSPSCLKCHADLSPPPDGLEKRTYAELEELHALGALVVIGIATGEAPSAVAERVQLYEVLDQLAIERMKRHGGTREADIQIGGAALDRTFSKLETFEGFQLATAARRKRSSFMGREIG